MRNFLEWTALVATFVTSLVVTGCSSSGHSGEKYYLIATNIKLPYWQTAGTGLNRAATHLKVDAEMVGPDTYDSKAEKEEFQRVVSRKPSGILVSVADPQILGSDIDAAVKAGIP